MQAYAQGNEAFVAGDFDRAVKSYSECIGEVKDWLDAAKGSPDLIFLRALSNRGYCFLKLRNYCDAAHDLSLSLQLLEGILAQGDVDPLAPSLFEKCLLRRALCYEYMTEYSKAMTDMETLIRYFPHAIRGKVVKELYSRLREAIRRDKVAVHAEPRPDYLINSAQRLRLSFLVDLPTQIPVNTRVFCKLCIGNEFGLFKRSYFRSIHEDTSERERILLDLSDPLPTDNKLEEYDFCSLSSVHIGKLGCSIIVLDGPADLVVMDIDGNADPSWPIGPDGKVSS
ncbi:tetratricopeptide repeat protein [archaeon]|nr:MAG: tetratricopeptide repeat protein [archaeon]